MLVDYMLMNGFLVLMQPPTLQFECLCNFLAELCLMDYTCVKFLPSQVAASVVFVAKFTLNPDSHPWVSLVVYSFKETIPISWLTSISITFAESTFAIL